MAFNTYDPGLVVVVFGAVNLSGYMDGTFVRVERNEDAYSAAAGAQGDVTRVRSRNRTGLVTATLKQESAANDRLSAIAAIDEASGLGVRPIVVKDLNGTALASAAEAWIRKLPDSEYSDGAGGREWVFECAELHMLVGGALV